MENSEEEEEVITTWKIRILFMTLIFRWGRHSRSKGKGHFDHFSIPYGELLAKKINKYINLQHIESMYAKQSIFIDWFLHWWLAMSQGVSFNSAKCDSGGAHTDLTSQASKQH